MEELYLEYKLYKRFGCIMYYFQPTVANLLAFLICCIIFLLNETLFLPPLDGVAILSDIVI